MTNVIDNEKLEDIFDIDMDEFDDLDELDLDDIEIEVDNISEKPLIENTHTEREAPTPTTAVVDTTPVEEKSDEDFVNTELKSLLTTTHKLMDAASYILDGSPDAETIASASSLVGSIKDVLSEINKSVLVKTRFKEQIKLEQLKIDARQRTAEFKAKQKIVDMGSGNTFIQATQNNNVPTSQEDIVDMIIGIQKESEQNKRLE